MTTIATNEIGFPGTQINNVIADLIALINEIKIINQLLSDSYAKIHSYPKTVDFINNFRSNFKNTLGNYPPLMQPPHGFDENYTNDNRAAIMDSNPVQIGVILLSPDFRQYDLLEQLEKVLNSLNTMIQNYNLTSTNIATIQTHLTNIRNFYNTFNTDVSATSTVYKIQ